MRPAKVTQVLLPVVAAALVTLPHSAAACAACFGKSDSPMAHGMNMGILTLLIVVVFVLSGFAAFFVYLVRKSALGENAPPDNSLAPPNPLHP